jgi:hypothetical protein
VGADGVPFEPALGGEADPRATGDPAIPQYPRSAGRAAATPRELAAVGVRFGYRRLTVLLKREGWRVNAKRIYRLYGDEGLTVYGVVKIEPRGSRSLSPSPRTWLGPQFRHK